MVQKIWALSWQDIGLSGKGELSTLSGVRSSFTIVSRISAKNTSFQTQICNLGEKTSYFKKMLSQQRERDIILNQFNRGNA